MFIRSMFASIFSSNTISIFALLLSIYNIYKNRRNIHILLDKDNDVTYNNVSGSILDDPISEYLKITETVISNPYTSNSYPKKNGKFRHFKVLDVYISNNSPNTITIKTPLILNIENEPVNVATAHDFSRENDKLLDDQVLVAWGKRFTKHDDENSRIPLLVYKNINLYLDNHYILGPFETKIWSYALASFDKKPIPNLIQCQVFTTIHRNYVMKYLITFNNYIIKKLNRTNSIGFIRTRDPKVKDFLATIKT